MYDIYKNATPPFITADSVLAKYHDLLLRTMMGRDLQFAKLVREDLKRGWEKLAKIAEEKPEADPAVCAAALRRARIVCGTARSLLDPAWHADVPELEKEIAAEAKRVTDAVAAAKPAWLGPPEPKFVSLDYAGCKPVGRWAENEKSGSYFRAIRFLQMVPFRLSRQDELFSACYLLWAITDAKGDSGLNTLARFDSSIGPLAFGFVRHALFVKSEEASPLHATLSEQLTYVPYREFEYPHLINNLIASRAMSKADMDTRFAVPIAFPDSVLMQRAMDQQSDRDSLPDPLLVAGWLGDAKAMAAVRKLLPVPSDDFPARKLVQPPPHAIERTETLIDVYYNALQTLMSGPEQGAPEFMSTDAWRLKTRQTVLASWAKTRNTFALEAEYGVGFGGGPPSYPGFVEPVPEFYQRLGHLAMQMAQYCNQDRDKEPERQLLSWLLFARSCQQLEAMAHKQLRGIEWNELDRDFIGSYSWQLADMEHSDKPLAATVERSGLSGTNLIVASGLNRVIWVNYPWHGKKILSKGAVMTFYSFPSATVLTDKEWTERLHATPAPQPPGWLKPIVGDDGK